MPPGSGDARYALIIAVSEYADSTLDDLAGPRTDAERLARVLKRADIGDFRKVTVLPDADHATARREIETFFAARQPLDIAVLHFSGHGFRGPSGDQLFLAMTDTFRDRPYATAVSGDFLRDVIEHSPARRKLVLLDCCHSGALQLRSGGPGSATRPVGPTRAVELFAESVKRIAPEDAQPQVNAMGTVIIGAARASEAAEDSALTDAVVEGLETGEADVNATGQISTENLFEYVTDWFEKKGPQRQHPVVQQRSRSGRFIIARNCMFQPAALPEAVERLLLDPDPARREEAVHHLRLLAVAAEREVAETAFRRLQHLEQFDFAEPVTIAASEAVSGMAPSARPPSIDFGRMPVGAPAPHRAVHILAPPPARGWRIRRPHDPALHVTRDGDEIQVQLDTAQPRRVDTKIRVDSVAGAVDVRVTARVHGASWWARPVTAWQRLRPAPRPAAAATAVRAGRRRAAAIAAAVLLLLLVSSIHRVPAADVFGFCVPEDDLRVLTTDALRDAVAEAAAEFAAPPPDEPCATVRVTVSSVTSDGVAQRQFAAQWPDADLRVAGPSPDVWLPESSVQVSLARAAIPADAPLRLTLPADPAALSVASSPLVLAVPATRPKAGELDRAGVLAGDWTIPRADPRNSSVGLLATSFLYGRDAAGAPAAERVLDRSQGGDDARYDLCTFRLSAAPPPGDTAFLVTQKDLVDYGSGRPLGAACRTNRPPPLNRGLRAVPVDGAPGLDMPCVPIEESAWGDDDQRKLAADFCTYLREKAGPVLRRHGLGPPDPAAAQLRDVRSPDQVITAWSAEQRPVRMLLAMDVSGSMNLPMPGTRTTRIAATKAAAERAVTGRSFGADDQIGLWRFATALGGGRDYAELVPLAAATSDQQTRVADALGDLTATDRDTGLHDTISAGITRLRDTRPAGAGLTPVDLLVVLTDGENDDPGSIGVAEIGRRLRAAGVQVAVIASVGANCRAFRPLVEQGLGCFDANRVGLDAAFDQALPSRQATP